MNNIKQQLLYTEEHEWVKQENNEYYVGITDFAANAIGEVVYVELPEVGEHFDKNDEFGSIESVKSVAELYMPISGEIIAVNELLADEPELVNDEPYEAGWMVKIKADDLGELMDLLSFDAYQEIAK